MPLFMEVHRNVAGLSADEVLEAHRADVEMQGKYNVTYGRYWFDEHSGTLFRLVEAPDAESTERVRRDTHGLLADEVVPVREGT